MVSPRDSRRRNSSQVAHCGTRLEWAISPRGAHSGVRITPPGLPDWTSRVSSPWRSCRLRTIASWAGQLRAARPEPPYTMSWSGCSATSGSRLFISMRIAPSVAQLLQLRWVPRGAWMGSLLCVMSPSWPGGNQSDKRGGALLGFAWAWQTHAATRAKLEAAMADPENGHLEFVRLENPGAVRRFLPDLRR